MFYEFFRNIIFCLQFKFIIYNVRKHYYINKIMYYTLSIKKRTPKFKNQWIDTHKSVKSNSKLIHINLHKLL